MAPVETSAASRSNNVPILLFGGQTLLVASLTAHVLLTTRRAAKALPPSTRTRSQNDIRRRHARIFSAIALLSLASVTAFSVIWRVISYVQWAELGNKETPGSLWKGWYGTGESGVIDWHLGDWIMDVDLAKESDAVAILRPEGFYYTAQHFVGLLASAIFIGIEGHRRNLSGWTIASFVTMGAFGSLGYALSLFFVTMLYTPLTIHSGDTPLHDTLYTPRPAVYWAPIVASLLSLNEFPALVAHRDAFHILRAGYLLVPLFLAFAPQITPVFLGISHPTKAHAHRSYATVFHFLSLVSLVFYARVFYINMAHSIPSAPNPVWELFAHAVGKDTSASNRLLQGFGSVARKLSKVSRHPALSVTTLDVLFTTVALLTWTFTRDLDVEALLSSSVLSFLVPAHRHHVRFFEPLVRKLEAATHPTHPTDSAEAEAEADADADAVPPTTPKKRGRKPNADKASTTATASPDASQSVRRSTRRTALAAFDNAVESITGSPTPGSQSINTLDAEPDLPEDDPADKTYVPDAETQHSLVQTETDGAEGEGDVVDAAESTALAAFLALMGGLGALSCAVLGGEVGGQ